MLPTIRSFMNAHELADVTVSDGDVDPIPDGHVFTQPWPATEKQRAAGRRDKTIFYRYSADSARRSLSGIDKQVAKAERAVAGKAPVKRNGFVQLAGGTRSVNRDLEAKARAFAATRYIEAATGWSIKRFVRAARRYRTIQIRAGNQTLTAEDPLPDDLRDALAMIN